MIRTRAMFKNISIRTRLNAAFSLFLALVAGIGVLALIQLKEFNDLGAQFTEEWVPEVEILGELNRAIHEHHLLAERRIQTQDFRQLVAINKAQRKTAVAVETAVQTYLETDKMGHGTELIKNFAAQWKRYEDILGKVGDLLNRGEFDRGSLVFRDDAVPSFSAGASLVGQLVDEARTQGSEAAEALERTHTRFLWLTIAVIAFATLCAGAIFVWISRGISTPIQRVSDAMNQLSSGNDWVEIPDGKGRRDEIGALLIAAERYRDSLILSRRLAERLDVAINNMPLGLVMFDKEKKLIVCNSRYREIYQVPEELTRTGTPLSAMYDDRIKRGLIAQEGADTILAEIRTKVPYQEPISHIIELSNGRTVSATAQYMPSGGWVALHEDVTEKRKTEERIAYMARHDMLTGLSNRFHFREQTELALRKLGKEESLAILCLDLDRFKAVNDTLGHPIGDKLLCLVAERLRDELREDDVIGRLGGDEFAIAQTGGDQPVSATALSDRIIRKISEPYEIDGHQIISGTSIGICIAPSDGTDPDKLLKNADMALYRAKQEARGTYRFFEMDMDIRMQQRRKMEYDLRHALTTDEFELHYQPQLNLKTNDISGFEALLRWNHPDRNIPPGEFIPLAEEIGLIIPIGKWVLSQACMDAAQWPESYNIAINLSPVQFKDPNLVEAVREALKASGLRPDRLELEITETVLLNDTPAVLSILHQFHDLGVRVSLDDFGTGYSSLSYLRSFPFDKIKIDRSFINDLGPDGNANAIIRAVTGLGASLGMVTTAEGIETVDQLMRVRQEGCTEVQGFLIGKPKPLSEIAGLIRTPELFEREIKLQSGTFKQ